MRTKARSVVLRVPEDVSWVKDTNQILVMNEMAKDIYILREVETIIWGWLSCSYGYRKLTEMIATLLRLTEEDAKELLSDVFKKWLALGIIEVFEEPSRG